MTWVAFAGAVIQLVFLILSNKFEKDNKERERKDEMLKDWDKAVSSGDDVAINDLLVKLRMHT